MSLAAPALTASTAPVLGQQAASGGGSSVLMLAMLAALAVLMVLNGRRAKKARAQQAAMLDALAPGQEVLLAAGLYGRLVSVDPTADRAAVEVAPGTVVSVHRQAIADVVAREEPVPATPVSEAPAGSTAAPAAAGPRTDPA